jgi:VanZ family protein
MISSKTKISLFFLLAVITFVGHNYIKQYKKCGAEILTNNWIIQSSKGTTAEIKGKQLFLFSLDHPKSVTIKQDISPVINGSTLELSADIKCENVRPGVESYNRARLLLMQYDREGNGLSLPHGAASLSGTKKWKNYIDYFHVVPETERIKVSAQLSHCTGSLWVENIHLYPVTKTGVYTYFRIIILATWGLYLIFLLGPCFFYGKNNIVIRMILLVLFILIIIGVTMPADMKIQISAGVKELINSLGVFSGGYGYTWNPAKVGHFFFFLLLGLVLSLLLKHESDTMVIINILLLAGSTEIMQLFIEGRSFLLWDVIIDLNGALYGFILSKLLLSIRRDI